MSKNKLGQEPASNLRDQITDLRQYIFKIETEFEMKSKQKDYCDLAFLKNLKEQMIKWRDRKDVVGMEMSFKMVEDWIDELLKQENND